MTVDDDEIYNIDMVQAMWNSHINHPDLVVGGAGRLIERVKNGSGKWEESKPILLKYGTLEDDIEIVDTPTKHQEFRCYGSTGVLYPAKFFSEMTINDIDGHIAKYKPPAKWSDDFFIYSYGKKHGFKWMVVEGLGSRWRGTIEHSLGTASDETSHTWTKDIV